ncbi:MAG TPA: L-threonylcarbamoyladenylate synthase, partial [Acidimicrobiia bacterium]
MTADIDVARAVDALRAGKLVAFPTETVYGLGADAASSASVARLYNVKGRPHDHPVIVHVHAADALDRIATAVPDWARALAAECWPGPLTLVVPRRAGAVADEVTGGRDTVGVRVPAHPVAL